MAKCMECGYDGDAQGPDDLVHALRAFGRRFADRLNTAKFALGSCLDLGDEFSGDIWHVR